MAKTMNNLVTRDKNNLNKIKLVGVITGNAEFSHSIVRKKGGGNINIDFLRFTLEVPRLSGVSDALQVVVRKEIWNGFAGASDSEPVEGAPKALVEVCGRIQTYNRNDSETGRSTLDIFIFAKSIRRLDVSAIDNQAENGAEEAHNSALLEGYLCKAPIIRKTARGRVIADLFIAVNHNYGTAYIPVIVWGGNAVSAANLKTGDKLRLEGRFQSREYRKGVNGGTVSYTAYEVSASSVRKLLEV